MTDSFTRSLSGRLCGLGGIIDRATVGANNFGILRGHVLEEGRECLAAIRARYRSAVIRHDVDVWTTKEWRIEIGSMIPSATASVTAAKTGQGTRRETKGVADQRHPRANPRRA